MAFKIVIVCADENEKREMVENLYALFKDDVPTIIDYVPDFVSLEFHWGITEVAHMYANHSLILENELVELVLSEASGIEQIADLRQYIKSNEATAVELAHELIVMETIVEEEIPMWDAIFYKPSLGFYDRQIGELFSELIDENAVKVFGKLSEDIDEAADTLMEIIQDRFGLNPE